MPSPSNPAHLRGGIGLRFIVPVAFLMLGALALVGGLLWVGSLKQDELGLSHQRQLVEHAIRSRLSDLSITAKDYSWWDDAVRYLVREFDPDWADGNPGIYVLEMFGYDYSFVIDGADRTLYAALDGERASADAFATLSPDLRNLIEEARRAPQDEPQAAAGLLHGTDGVVLVAASAVLPQEGSELELPPGPRSVLVLAQRLDEPFLQGAEDAYRIRGLRLLPAQAQAPAAALPLIAPDGARLGCLTWLPERPGWKLVRWVMPGLSGALLLFVAFTVGVMRYIQRAAATIKFGETRFRDIAEASSDWIWETDAQLRVEFVSERFAEITGLGRDRVLGRTLAGLFHPAEELERWERHLGDLGAQRPFRDVLCRLDEAPNHDRTLRIAGKPIVDGDGSFRGYRGTATDIAAEVARLARGQERELRTWLYGAGGYRRPGASTPADAGLTEALAAAAAEVEDTYALMVRPVVVGGDRALDDDLRALVLASREAMVNAAKHAGVDEVSVYAEVEPDEVNVFVRDRGAGFEPDAVPDDRHGLADSVRGRMTRHGGTVRLRTHPGDGTEVHLRMPVATLPVEETAAEVAVVEEKEHAP